MEGIDRQIDLLVYELYGRSEEEIRIAEGPRQGMEGEKKLIFQEELTKLPK